MKDLGSLNFLGIHVTWIPKEFHHSQFKYVADILDHAKMIGAKPAKTPLPTRSKLSQYDGDPIENATE